jgi:methylmalonyl-CoA mutase, N-terminal domain
LSTTAHRSNRYANWLEAHADSLATHWRERYATSSGFEVKPVWTPEDLEDRGWTYSKDLGFPGEEPWTRGFVPGGYRQELWKLEMYAGFGSAEDANKR